MVSVEGKAGSWIARTAFAWASLAVAALAHAAPDTARKLQAPPALAPSARLLVEPLGFLPPSRFYLTYRVPSATLDFVDDTHLLFTFHKSALMRREEQEPEEDEDQTIQALLLELPSGKIVEQTSWRLHDKGRYLWALDHGRFLIRERNDFYMLDRTLAKRTHFLHVEGPVLAVQLSADRKQLMVQYQVEKPQPAAGAVSGDATPTSAPTLGSDAPPHRVSHQVRMLMIDTVAARIQYTAVLAHAIVLPLIENGYLDVQQGTGKGWDVMLTPFGGEPHLVTQLRSGCQPMLHALNREVFLAELCVPNTSDHLMQAYNAAGNKLWEQQWESRYIWGYFGYAENGSRFAYESIQLDHPLATLDPVDETSIMGQPIGVYDMADGTLRMVAGADPILSAGQNFALSADGQRFAVLRKGAVEVYTLQPAGK